MSNNVVSPRSARAAEKFNKEFEKIKKEIFSFFDKDGDKVLSYNELVVAIRAIGVIVNDSDLERIHGSRQNFDYAIFSSLIESFREKKQVATIPSVHVDVLKSLKQAFEAVDVKNTGHVSSAELKAIICGMGNKLSDEEFRIFFPDASANVSFEQFVSMITKGIVAG